MRSNVQMSHKSDLEIHELIPGATVNFTHSEKMTFAEWNFKAGTLLPEHSHKHEQITKVLSGDFELTVNGEVLNLSEGSIVVIPSNATHSGKPITKCHIIDVFHPVREDYR